MSSKVALSFNRAEMGCGAHLAQHALVHALFVIYTFTCTRVRLMFEGGSTRWGRGGVSVYSAPDNAPVRASAAPAVLSATSLRDSRFCVACGQKLPSINNSAAIEHNTRIMC